MSSPIPTGRAFLDRYLTPELADPPLPPVPRPLLEDPPVTVSTSGAVWSRACPHCEHRLVNVHGPSLNGHHLCTRDGVVHLVQWVNR